MTLTWTKNVVPDTHPDGPWIKNWLSMHGFHEVSRGQLRRQVDPVRRPARALGRGPARWTR